MSKIRNIYTFPLSHLLEDIIQADTHKERVGVDTRRKWSK